LERLVQALTSRRVVVAGAALIVGILTLYIPELESVRDELLILIVTLSLMLIGGFSLDEAARIGRERAEQSDEELREKVKQLLEEIIDELMIEEQKE